MASLLMGGRRKFCKGEAVKASNGVGSGDDIFLPNLLGDLGNIVWSPSGVRGKAPAENELLHF